MKYEWMRKLSGFMGYSAMLILAAGPAIAQTGTVPQTGGSEALTALKSDSLEAPVSNAGPKTDKSRTAGETMLASDLIGQNVFSSDGRNVGTIADMVLSSDLDGMSAIVSVGGFLGIGGKDVAVPQEKFELTRDENGALRLQVSATEEQLRTAPVFDRTKLLR